MKPEFVIFTVSSDQQRCHYAQETTMRRALLSIEGAEFVQAIVACRDDRLDEAIEMLQAAKIARAARAELRLQQQIESTNRSNEAQHERDRYEAERKERGG